MFRPKYAAAALTAMLACSGNDGPGGSGLNDGAIGAAGDGGLPPIVSGDFNETAAPEPVTVTPESGGTIRSAAGLLEIVIPPGAVTEAVQLSVVRLRGADVPANAMAGIAHTIHPLPPYWNSVAQATWTIPGSIAKGAFGTSMAWPLPYVHKQNTTAEPHGVTRYQPRDDGGFQLKSYAPSPPTAIYLSTDHAMVTTVATDPRGGELGGVDFTVTPAPGSQVKWVGGAIGSSDTTNWERAGSAVEGNPMGGLTGYFRGTCDFAGYGARLSFEVKADITVGLFDLEYDAYVNAQVDCPR